MEVIRKVLDQNKAEQIEIFNLENSEYMVSGVVLATALADRHLQALLENIKSVLTCEKILHTDVSDEWIVIDLGDILIHIMAQRARDKYNLEEFLDEFKKRRG
jgi:ribosome silencing factor RsfS/YbeB/iojap